MIIASSKKKEIEGSHFELAASSCLYVKSLDVSNIHKKSYHKHLQHTLYYMKLILIIRYAFSQTMSSVQTLIVCRIDYCNSLLIGLPDGLIARLQRVINTSARFIFIFKNKNPILVGIH